MSETFALQLKAFADKAKGNAQTVVRRAGLEVLTGVVMKTPVGNPSLWKHPAPKGYVGGRLRANWNVSLSVPDDSTNDGRDKSGALAISRGAPKINEYTGEDIYIMNSLPYAIPVEYGHSIKQAPAGMVRVTVAEFQNFVDRAAASVK